MGASTLAEDNYCVGPEVGGATGAPVGAALAGPVFGPPNPEAPPTALAGGAALAGLVNLAVDALKH